MGCDEHHVSLWKPVTSLATWRCRLDSVCVLWNCLQINAFCEIWNILITTDTYYYVSSQGLANNQQYLSINSSGKSNYYWCLHQRKKTILLQIHTDILCLEEKEGRLQDCGLRKADPDHDTTEHSPCEQDNPYDCPVRVKRPSEVTAKPQWKTWEVF